MRPAVRVQVDPGKLANLESRLGEDPLEAATLGIGPTRWATHGGPTDAHAHPHVSEDGTVRADVAGQSLCEITYTTRCRKWRVRDGRNEQLQLVAEL